MGLKAPIVSFGKHTAAGPEGPGDLGLTWVTIDDPGNIDDIHGAGYGGVDYTFRIMKYAVRESDIDAYNADPANASLQITLADRGDDKPATNVSWNKAARYVNWLNTREGFPVAYQFDTGGVNDNIALWDPGDPGYDVNNRYRSSIAEYFLPSEDEWYKAAYYNGSIYYDYATGSDTAPTAVASGTTAGTAVYDGQSGPADVDQAGGLSPYGTMGQGGNTYEWNESAYDGTNDSTTESRVLRGGFWNYDSAALQSSFRSSFSPGFGFSDFGFRVAAVPE